MMRILATEGVLEAKSKAGCLLLGAQKEQERMIPGMEATASSAKGCKSMNPFNSTSAPMTPQADSGSLYVRYFRVSPSYEAT
jgi:hypothetical protein